jgi:hypothetical protein
MPIPENPPSNAFLSLLDDLRDGDAKSDLHLALTKLVASVRSVGKAGKLTFKLKVKLAKNGGAVVIDDEVDVVEPKPEVESTLLFADDDNVLTRRDPRQPRLPETELRSFRSKG